MWKSASSAFRKCGTFLVYDFLKGSYWPSKSSKISKKKFGQRRCCKKKTRSQFWFFGPETNSQGNSYGGLHLLFVSDPKTQNCGSSFFLTPLIFGDGPEISKSVDFEQLPLKSSHDPKVPHFRKPRDLSFLMVLSWKNFPIKKYRGEGFFAIFHVHSEKNFKWLPIGQFWS